MHSLEPPDPPARRGLWAILVVALLGAGALAWYVAGGAGTPPSGPPPVARDADGGEPGGPADTRTPGTSSSGNDGPPRTERPAAPAAAPRTTTPRPAAPPADAAAGPRELRVTSDVPGAYVFLDRKYLGTTPLVSREVTPGAHQLNVQVEGRPPYVQSIDVAERGTTAIAVALPAAAAAPAAAVSASVAVVHQHGMGSCEGTLRAAGDVLRYDTAHKDAFSVPLAAIETFTMDVQEKRLRVKQRGGRTWNFTTRDDTAAALATFHHQVDAARPR